MSSWREQNQHIPNAIINTTQLSGAVALQAEETQTIVQFQFRKFSWLIASAQLPCHTDGAGSSSSPRSRAPGSRAAAPTL